MKITDALKKLDPENNDHWTSEGVARVDAVTEVLGREITRQQITNADHSFNRQSLIDTLSKDLSDSNDSMDTKPIQIKDEVEIDATESSSGEEVFDNEVDEVHQQMKTNIDDLTKRLAGFDEEISDLDKSRGDIEKQLLNAQEKMINLYPNSTNGSAIRNYIESQKTIRETRVANRKKILGAITPNELRGKAPIDEAMSRKNNRGTLRPSRDLNI